MAPRRRFPKSKKLSLMNNKWVLYLLSFVSICQLVTYGLEEKWESTILFVALGLLARNYSKNMIVVLLTAIVGAGLFSHFIKNNEGFKEGANGEGEDEEEEDEDDDDDEEDGDGDDEEEEEGDGDDGDDDGEDDGFRGSYVDKASTMKQNFNNIRKMVGKGGMEKMTRETAALMKQQNKMLENMEKMKPLTEQATGLVEQLESSNLLKSVANNKHKFAAASKQLSSLKNIA